MNRKQQRTKLGLCELSSFLIAKELPYYPALPWSRNRTYRRAEKLLAGAQVHAAKWKCISLRLTSPQFLARI